jgi:hypothetical protein
VEILAIGDGRGAGGARGAVSRLRLQYPSVVGEQLTGHTSAPGVRLRDHDGAELHSDYNSSGGGHHHNDRRFGFDHDDRICDDHDPGLWFGDDDYDDRICDDHDRGFRLHPDDHRRSGFVVGGGSCNAKDRFLDDPFVLNDSAMDDRLGVLVYEHDLRLRLSDLPSLAKDGARPGFGRKRDSSDGIWRNSDDRCRRSSVAGGGEPGLCLGAEGDRADVLERVTNT